MKNSRPRPTPSSGCSASTRRIYPKAARDDAGRDVLPLLLARDQRYPDRFPRSKLGVAPLHTLELDFRRTPRRMAAPFCS